MTPRAKPPEGALADQIQQAFGGLAGLKEKFVAEGVGHFGSGWVWLLAGPQGLQARSTHDGQNVLGEEGVTPLLTCDLWEHAYYIDFRNDRKSFLEKWFDALADWSFAGHQLQAAKGKGEAWRYPPPDGEPARRHG
jgi:Fe-Mn family superoxide dismutase